MAGYNRTIMVGNLTRDPDHKQLGSGQSVCRLSIASNRQFRNRQSGEMVQEVCYMDVDVWGPQADSCNKYLEKGRQVLVEGRIKFDTWQDQEGNKKNKHSIVADRVVFLSSQNEASDNSSTSASTESQTTNEKMEPRNDVERELMSQLDSITTTTKAATPSSKSADVPQAEPKAATFKDAPPFQDDLPF